MAARFSRRSRPAWYWAVPALALSATLVWCSCDGPGGPDGGPDAGDASDAGRDAGRDAGADAGRRADAGSGADWRLVPDLPEDCRVEVAANPAAAFAPFTFVPCGDGCREWVTGLGGHRNPERSEFYVHDENAYLGPGEPLLSFGRAQMEGRVDYNYYAVTGFDGVHRAVIRGPHPMPGADRFCSPAGIYPERGSSRFTVLVAPGGGGRQKFFGDLLHAEPGTAVPLWAGPSAPTTTGTSQRVMVAEGVAAFESVSPIQVWRVAADGTVDLVSPGGPGEPYSQLSDVVNGSILVSRESTTATGAWDIWIARPGDATVEPYLGGPAGAAAAGPHGDGVDLVWNVGVGATTDGLNFDDYELWTSPWSANAAELAPRRLGTATLFNIGGDNGVGHGKAWWATEAGPGIAGPVLVFDLAGGPTRMLPNDDPTHRVQDVIPGPEEVMVTFRLRVPRNGIARTSAVRFYRYESLPLAP